MILIKPHESLVLASLPEPHPKPHQLKLKVHCCGVCRTDLHVLDGDLKEPKLPLVMGHQIVGVVTEIGAEATGFKVGDRVGVPWLGGSCGNCEYCNDGMENLCDNAVYTGYQHNGGFAEYCVADHRFCFPIPDGYTDAQAAPLLCAGLIGYRALSKCDGAKRLGLYGFGAAAHILAQIAKFQGREVYSFTRPGDEEAQAFAIELGAKWAGDSNTMPPKELDAAIIFASIGALVPKALRAVKKGGKVVCAGIHMSDVPSFPYDALWGERSVSSVANLTRRDGSEFLALVPDVPIETEINAYPLDKANDALRDLRDGKLSGAAVITVSNGNGSHW